MRSLSAQLGAASDRNGARHAMDASQSRPHEGEDKA